MELLPPSVLRLYLQASPLSVNSLKLNNLQSKLLYLSLSINNHFSHKTFPFPFGFTFGSSWNLLVSGVCIKDVLIVTPRPILHYHFERDIFLKFWLHWESQYFYDINTKTTRHSATFSLSFILNQTKCLSYLKLSGVPECLA